MRPLPSMEGARLAVAGLVAVLAIAFSAASATASTTINLGPQAPTAPVHVVVGDQIVVTLPPISTTPSPGQVIVGDPRYPLPTSSDSTVLPRLSAAYQADGTAVAAFQAAAAGTATIKTTTPQLQYCTLATPSPSPTPTPTPPATSSVHNASRAQLASTTPSPSPTFSQCASSVALYQVTVIVSSTGVQGVTVPATGSVSNGPPGAAIAAVGVLVTAFGLGIPVARRVRQRRSNNS